MTQQTAGNARRKKAGRKPTEQERAERRAQDRERMDAATRALLDSDGWMRWVTVRSRNGLSRYSFGNQLLIAMQCPEATYVAGFKAFLELERCVRKGERAIRILAPMTIKTKDAEKAEGQDGDGRRVVFRAVPVFDVSQTEVLPDREPVALEPPSEPVDGDSHEGLLKPLEEIAKELGFEVSGRVLDGPAEGWCDEERKEIVINRAMAANGQVRVLVHEIAHALGIDYEEYGRQRAEVLVDTVTFIVCSSVGLDVSGSSVPYVTGWGEAGELDAIRKYAETIDGAARVIEDGIRVRMNDA